MREGISVEVSAADRARLEAVVADGNSPQKHVWRAGVILATADGLGTGGIMRRKLSADSDDVGRAFRDDVGHRFRSQGFRGA